MFRNLVRAFSNSIKSETRVYTSTFHVDPTGKGHFRKVEGCSMNDEKMKYKVSQGKVNNGKEEQVEVIEGDESVLDRLSTTSTSKRDAIAHDTAKNAAHMNKTGMNNNTSMHSGTNTSMNKEHATASKTNPNVNKTGVNANTSMHSGSTHNNSTVNKDHTTASKTTTNPTHKDNTTMHKDNTNMRKDSTTVNKDQNNMDKNHNTMNKDKNTDNKARY